MFHLTRSTDATTTYTHTLSLHDALPIFENLDAVARQPLRSWHAQFADHGLQPGHGVAHQGGAELGLEAVEFVVDRRQGKDRKSTRLNSSHITISYAVFCLKKKTLRSILG